jgi:hypothetical protein
MRFKIFGKLTKKILLLLTIVQGIYLGLVSCNDSPTPESGFHFYIVLSPINENQAKQAQTLLLQAKGKGQPTARVIVPGNRYTIAKFCTSENPDFPNSGIDMVEDTTIKMQAITGSAEQALNKIIAKTVICKASATSLVNLVPFLNSTATQRPEKMIILIQAPWSKPDIEKISTEIKEGMDKLSQSGKVEKIIVFGVQEDASDSVAKIFESFNAGGADIYLSAATDTPQIVDKLQDISRDVLKQKTK